MTRFRRLPYRASKHVTRQHLRAFLASVLPRLPQEGRVLCVGAGGEVGEAVAKLIGEQRVITLDIDPMRYPDAVGDISYSPFRPGTFTSVVMCEVLEHVQQPHCAVESVVALLAPGGTLVLSSPFMFPIHEGPGDYFRFTEHGLRLLLAGLESVEVRGKGGWGHSLLVVPARLYREFSGVGRAVAALAAVLAAAVGPLAALCDRLASRPFATMGYCVTARKPSVTVSDDRQQR